MLFFFNDTATTEIYTLSLHDALPILPSRQRRAHHHRRLQSRRSEAPRRAILRSEEHTSELQSQFHLVCRLLLEKKKSRASRRSRGTAAGTLSRQPCPPGAARPWRSAC